MHCKVKDFMFFEKCVLAPVMFNFQSNLSVLITMVYLY